MVKKGKKEGRDGTVRRGGEGVPFEEFFEFLSELAPGQGPSHPSLGARMPNANGRKETAIVTLLVSPKRL